MEKFNKTQEDLPHMKVIISITGGIIPILLYIFTHRNSFSKESYCFLIILFFAIFLLGCIYILFSLFKKRISNLRINRRRNLAIKNNLKDFKLIVKRFEQFSNPYNSNIGSVLCKTSFKIDKNDAYGKEVFLLDQNFFSYLHKFYENILIETLKKDIIRRDKFLYIEKQFNRVVYFYNEIICKAVREFKRRDKNLVSGDYEKYREIYKRYLEDYFNLGSKINEEYGEQIFNVPFDFPEKSNT